MSKLGETQVTLAIQKPPVSAYSLPTAQALLCYDNLTYLDTHTHVSLFGVLFCFSRRVSLYVALAILENTL